MNRYRFCDLTLDSAFPLPELSRSRARAVDGWVELADDPAESLDTHDWFHEWRLPDGSLWASFAHVDGGYLIRFAELAEFAVTDDARKVRCRVFGNTPAATIRHLLLDQVLPLVRSLQGDLVLHAASVVVDGGAVAFCGQAGRGKSTLTASFERAGYRSLSDDCLLVLEREQVLEAIPSYPGFRLWPDMVSGLFGDAAESRLVAHYTPKRRIKPRQTHPRPSRSDVALRRVYALDPPDGATAVAIVPVAPRDALMTLMESAFRLDITDRAAQVKELDRLARLVSRVAVCRLRYPRELSALPAVREAILADVRGDAVVARPTASVASRRSQVETPLFKTT